MTVAGLEREFVETAAGLYVPIASRRVQFTIDAIEVDGTVSRVQVHLALESANLDLAIAGAEVHFALARHLDDDFNFVRSPVDVEVVMRIVHVDFHRIPGLAFFDANATLADLVV